MTSVGALIRGVAEIVRVFCITGWISARFFLRWNKVPRGTLLGIYTLELVTALGPLYLKLAQILAAQSGLVADGFRAELRSTFDRNSIVPFRLIRKRIEAAYGFSFASVFRDIDPEPIGSGSVAQVHLVTLVDGTKAALKVIKPGAAQSLGLAINAATLLVRVIEFSFRSLRPLRLVENFEDIRYSLLRQTDLTLELSSQRSAADRFAGHPFVVIPRVYEPLSNRDVLVMEYIDGIPLYDVGWREDCRADYAAKMQEVFYTMIYLHGRFHVDPHPGNMLLLADGRVALLDFGMVGSLSEEEKWGLAGFYYACMRAEWDVAVARFAALFVERGETLTAYPQACADLSAVLREHFRDRTWRWTTIGFIEDASAILRRYRLRIRAGMALIVLSLVTGEGVLLDVDPSVDIWRNARRFVDKTSPYVNDALRRHFDSAFLGASPNGAAVVRRAQEVLVAPVHLHRFFLPSEYPLVIKGAHGAYLRDADGRQYVDMSCGYGPHILGFGHPVATEAIAMAAASVPVNALTTEAEVALAELITDALPGADKVIFASSGSEAVTMAMRLCRAFTGRQKIAKFEGHYHGQSDQGLVSSWFRFSGDENSPAPISGCRGAFEPVVRDTVVLQFGSKGAFHTLEAAARELACVICEPMPGASCDINAPYLRALRDLCNRINVPLVFDEIVSGFRVDYGGVQTLIDVAPDLTCLGKIIGGGLPCGAVAGRREIIDQALTTNDPFADLERKTFVGGTFSGNAMTCSAGAAVLRHLRDRPYLYEELNRRTAQLKAAILEAARDEHVVVNVAAQTGIMSLEFSPVRPTTIRQKITSSEFRANLALSYFMRERGVYLPELHTLMLSTAHTGVEIDTISSAFAWSIQAMKREGILTAA